MRALVIGASGQVGGALLQALKGRAHNALGTYARHRTGDLIPLDITDPSAVERVVTAARPAWVFCPSGLTRVDYCEEHPEEAMAINRDGALHAARAAGRVGAGFVFYSTEYVFDGEGGPYGEDDPARPLSKYGLSKWEGERAVLAEPARALVVRTTVVYGPERQEKNFVYQLIRNCRSGQAMRIPSDQISSPTYNMDLAEASVELCERGLAGVYHLAGDGVLDRFAFARLACEVFELDPSRLVPVATAALGQKAPRPLKGGLRIAKAQAVLTTPLRTTEAGLRAMRAALEGTRPSPLPSRSPLPLGGEGKGEGEGAG